MQQIANWLQKLGLGQYAQRFAENDITFDILPDLSDQDFEKIGVASLGHRRQLLRAIVELKGAPQLSPVAPVPPRDVAERRQVTVMFSDLVGSTALSARIDPEDLREVISAYQKCVAETVQSFGGFVAKYMGDGVLVYFGYPQAHEDDAERAVRAGLKLVAAVGALKGQAPLQTRVGIATGLVVVGDLIGSGASQEQAIVLEAAVDGQEASETISRAALPSLAVPTTLHASLMARLDRLGSPAKEVAQIGAAIGREFSYELLILVAQKNEEEVKASLARLSDAGLVFCRGAPPEANFLFKHALVRDAAYGSLLRRQRLELHARIANTIEAEFPDKAAAQPEVLGHHAEEAGLSAKAIGFWQKAGELAVRRAANPEAIKHFRRALSLLGEQPDTVERSRNELAILSRLGPALMSSHGWASPEVRVAFERAAVVAKGIGNSVELAPPLLGLWLYHTSLGQLERAEGIGVELFEIARKNDSPDVLLQAYHAAFPIPWLRGALPEANRHIEALFALYDEAKHDQHRYVYLGHDPAVCALSIGAILQTLLGYPDRAARLEDRVLALARRLRHPPSLAHVLWFVGEAQLTRRDRAALAATAGELAALCEDQTLPSPRAAAAMFNGWVMAHSGKISEGILLVEHGLSAWQRIGIRHFLPRNHCLLAETYLAGERYTEGLAQVCLALKAAEQTGVRYNDALIYHLRALFLVHIEGMNSNNVEADLKTAIKIAQAQTAKGLELPAAVSLARLWRNQGRQQQARELLAPLYDSFTEGFDTHDLKEAKALLVELAS